MNLLRTATVTAITALFACGGSDSSETAGAAALPPGMQPQRSSNADATPPAVPFDTTTPRIKAVAIASWPHDTSAYTEGLFVAGDRLLESTGVKGKSDFREVEWTSGKVLRRVPLANAAQFGEGISVVGDLLYQLTWTDGRGYIYNAKSFAVVDSFSYQGEGWALTTDGTSLYMSDGSSSVRVVNPTGFQVTRTFKATESGKSVYMLNELEWVDGELWANIYETDFIARIDPATGQVVGWIDVSDLLTAQEQGDVKRRSGLANGIAYDAANKRVLLTGKMWPKVFAIALPPKAK